MNLSVRAEFVRADEDYLREWYNNNQEDEEEE